MGITYEPNSSAGPLDEGELRAFEGWLQRTRRAGKRIVFDPSYVEHLRSFNGGKPKTNCFVPPGGYERLVERFYHFASLPKEHPGVVDNAEVVWSQVDDRLGSFLIPFAELFAGDMLCFDFSRGGRPKVVIWLHEQSREDAPATEFVAENFDEFLDMLYDPDAPPGATLRPSVEAEGFVDD